MEKHSMAPEMLAEIDATAGQIGVAASDVNSPNGHYSAVRDFGLVQYRAVAIPEEPEPPRPWPKRRCRVTISIPIITIIAILVYVAHRHMGLRI
jgi:hypothetical protein